MIGETESGETKPFVLVDADVPEEVEPSEPLAVADEVTGAVEPEVEEGAVVVADEVVDDVEGAAPLEPPEGPVPAAAAERATVLTATRERK